MKLWLQIVCAVVIAVAAFTLGVVVAEKNRESRDEHRVQQCIDTCQKAQDFCQQVEKDMK